MTTSSPLTSRVGDQMCPFKQQGRQGGFFQACENYVGQLFPKLSPTTVCKVALPSLTLSASGCPTVFWALQHTKLNLVGGLPTITPLLSESSTDYYYGTVSKDKDTDGLNSFNRLLKSHGANPPTFAIFVFKNICPNNHTGHAEHLLQLLPADFVIQLKRKQIKQEKEQSMHQHLRGKHKIQ